MAQSTRKAARFTFWAAALLPPCLYLLVLPHFGRLPYNDYYDIVSQVTHGAEFSHDPAVWLSVKSNEHTVTLPTLVFAANIFVTNGDNRGLSAFALALLLTVLFCLIRLLPFPLTDAPISRTVYGLLLSLFVFTPVAAHSIVLGFSGTLWFMSNAFSVAAICVLTRGKNRSPMLSACLAAILGLLGAFSYSTNLSLWPALLAGAAILGYRARHFVPIVLVASAVYALVASGYHHVPWHPEVNTTDNISNAAYLGTYLGSLFSRHPVRAMVAGWCGLALAAVLVLVAVARLRRCLPELAPWLMLQIYALGNALGTAIWRSGLGTEQAMASRYASIAVLFWIGTVMSAEVLLRRSDWGHRRGRLTSPAVAAATLLLVIPMYHKGINRMHFQIMNAAVQPLSELAIHLSIKDAKALMHISIGPNQVWQLRDFMRARGHVPFDRPGPDTLDQHVDDRRLAEADSTELTGEIDEVDRLSDEAIRLDGWVECSQRDVAEVLILDQHHIVRGVTVVGLPRGRPDGKAAWAGYVLRAPRDSVLTAWARRDGETRYRPFGEPLARAR